MNTRLMLSLVVIVVLLTSVGGAAARKASEGKTSEVLKTSEVSTGFTFQGQLENAGAAVNGNCDMAFRLYDDPAAGTPIGSAITTTVPVSNSLFTVMLNTGGEFGANAFDGAARWLEMTVRCPAGSGDYITLAPRQALTPTPYASFSSSAPWSGVSGVPSPIAFLGNPSPCSTGQLATWNGTTWTCAAATPYSAGAGLALNGNLFSVNFSGTGSANTAARSDHAHSGADITSGTIPEARIDPLIARDSEITPTVLANDGSGSSLDADSLDGQHASAFVALSGAQTISGSKTFSDGVKFADGTTQTTASYRPTLPGPGLATTVDSAGYIGDYTSITIGTDGLGLISYHDVANGDLKVMHCGNVACNSDNISTTVDSGGTGGDVGYYTSITIGADGLGLISYQDGTNKDLKVLHCGNVTCNSGNVSTTVDSVGDVGYWAYITLGADGLGLISYTDGTNLDLKVLHCGNAACNSGNTITTVDSAGDVGRYTSITIGADGLGLISYYDVTNGDLKVLHCGNAACNSGNIVTTVDSANVTGECSSITIGADGLGLISYREYTNFNLKVLHCGNAACNSGNISTTVDIGGAGRRIGWWTSTTIGADGLGLISYLEDINGVLNVLHCGNAVCNSGNISTTVDSTSWVGETNSITIGADGLGLISYFDRTNFDLKVLHCGNRACTPYRVGR